MKVSLIITFIAILAFATVALGADVPPTNSTWVEGHWVTVEYQQVWITGYWAKPQKAPAVVYVQQPQVIYVQQPQVIYVQQPQYTFMTFGFSSGFYGNSCYHGHGHFAPRNNIHISGSFRR